VGFAVEDAGVQAWAAGFAVAIALVACSETPEGCTAVLGLDPLCVCFRGSEI
jgi:hypothetical protein